MEKSCFRVTPKEFDFIFDFAFISSDLTLSLFSRATEHIRMGSLGNSKTQKNWVYLVLIRDHASYHYG